MNIVHDQRGSASVEIVVMLPLFIVLFAGVYHLHASGSAALRAAERARGCAWQFAVSGCEGASKLELCNDVFAKKAADVKSESDAQAEPGDGVATQLEQNKGVLDKVAAIPVIGDVVEMLFGEGALASATQSAPQLMKHEKVSLQKTYYLTCNTVSKSWGDLVKDQVCAVISGQLNMEGRVLGCK